MGQETSKKRDMQQEISRDTTSIVGYQRLIVWQEAHTLVLLVYKQTKLFPKDELFGLTSQLRRAVVSIPANIVEGYARSSRKEFLQFLFISQGSLAEVEYYLLLSHELGYLTKDAFEELEAKRKPVGNLLHGLIASLFRKS